MFQQARNSYIKSLIVPITRPHREFMTHEGSVAAAAVFPNGRRMVTGSPDATLRLWDLQTGALLKKMKGHNRGVKAVAVSRDNKLIASGDEIGDIIGWDGETGRPVSRDGRTINGHSKEITSLDFSPDNAVLATVSLDGWVKLWRTDTSSWAVRGKSINSELDKEISCVRYSPSGEQLAIATAKYIQIWNPATAEHIKTFRTTQVPLAHISLAWTPNDGTRLFSSGCSQDPIILEWDTFTWKQFGSPSAWSSHTSYIRALAVDPTGSFIASASEGNHNVRLWRLSDRQMIAIFSHSQPVFYVAFSADGTYLLTGSGGDHMTLSEWPVPVDAPAEEDSESDDALTIMLREEQDMNNARHPGAHSEILLMDTIVREACLTNDLSAAERLLTQQINEDRRNHNAYANRALILARKGHYANALCDARESVTVQPSLTGFISKGIALCGKKLFKEAMQVFDIALMFTGHDLTIILLLLLVKAIALFNVDQHKEAMHRIRDLATNCPNAATTCHVVEAYLQIQLGISALTNEHYNEASEYFAAAINSGVLSCEVIHPKYEVFVIIFGWELVSSWKIANQGRCDALLLAGRKAEAYDAHRYMMNMADEATKTNCSDWCNGFKQRCGALYAREGDTVLAASSYERAIELYSTAIDLDSMTETPYINRCRAKLGKMLWKEALVDAEKVTELSPYNYLGYYLKHVALDGARLYDEAITAFQFILVKLDDADDPEMQELRKQYISPSEAQCHIQKVIDAQMENVPPRLLDTSTGYLCDRGAVINSFKASTEYKKLIIEYANHRSGCIQDVVSKFFQYAMLSHRWGTDEPFLYHIQAKNVYELSPVSGNAKLQSFCKVSHKHGYRWAWSDTCCIDKSTIIELQESINSMFAWYRHSALTIVYLSDVLPSSGPGALGRDTWISRGWTLQEILAPRVVLFYQQDWTLYLNDHSLNHKVSDVIMQELAGATGINSQVLINFHPEMRDAREKLHWSSMRVTTLQEDIAYSLCGIFGVHLSPIYGEKQDALGRLLQEIVAQSGDITCLDWVGTSSKFNSCLPASITSYAALPSTQLSLPEDTMQTSISSLQDANFEQLAFRKYKQLIHLRAPRFAQRRLHLPCIAFTVTRFTEINSKQHFTYVVKANGLHNVQIATEVKLTSFTGTFLMQRLLLVRPWDRNLIPMQLLVRDYAESSDLKDDAESPTTEESDYYTPLCTPLGVRSSDISHEADILANSASDSRALRLVVRLGQPFKALLLAQQWKGEYKRVAADQDIIAQVKDMASFCNAVRTVEIL